MESQRTAAQWLWLSNIAIGALVGLSYLEAEHLPRSPTLWLFAHLGLLSAVATLSLAPGALVWLLARARLRGHALGFAAALVWMLFLLALVIDTRVWGLFRYHFNSAAWNLITTRGSEDSYRLGPRVWAVGSGLALVIFGFQWCAWRWLAGSQHGAARAQRWRKPASIAIAMLVCAVGVEKSIYAGAELQQDARVSAVSRAFPLYPRVSVVPMLPEPLAAELGPSVPIESEGAKLAYPREWPVLAPNGPRPNVLFLVIDSWRGDMAGADSTPALAARAQAARTFEDHYSGGNGTRFGVFSLLYGLHGSYWWPVLEAGRAPVLLDTLLAAGYQPGVFSSASMDYPEFRRTAWSGIAPCVRDEFGDARASVRDQRVAEACLEFVRARDPQRPFFAFVLLDSAHQKYDFPDDADPFRPYAREIDYVELAGSRDPQLQELVRNRYRNALLHADRVAGYLLDELERTGELARTLVVVTGDHGEEFAEHGHWGHTGNFTPEQVRVPLFLLGPHIERGAERRRTSHVDVPATVLELLGADPSVRARWTLGGNLLAPQAQRECVVASWEDVGVWTQSGLLRVPRVPTAGMAISVWDERWRLVADQREALERSAASLERLAAECARFLGTADAVRER
ncbi:MAG: DUF3413 domain-containing protein [Planctomycetes bacterium]|nr:DUF3413 domain-containing protein [Planctomycetota bacterium]